MSAIPSDLCIIVIASAVILLLRQRKERTKKKEERKKEESSQKIDDLPVVATCRSGTLVMLSSKVNGPVAHGSTQQYMIWLMEAVD